MALIAGGDRPSSGELAVLVATSRRRLNDLFTRLVPVDPDAPVNTSFWSMPEPSVVDALFAMPNATASSGSTGPCDLVLVPVKSNSPASALSDPIASTVAALQLYSRLRELFGERDLLARTIRTARAIGWLSHAWKHASLLVAAEGGVIESADEDSSSGFSLFAAARVEAADAQIQRLRDETAAGRHAIRNLEEHVRDLRGLLFTSESRAEVLEDLVHELKAAEKAATTDKTTSATVSVDQLAQLRRERDDAQQLAQHLETELSSLRRRQTLTSQQLQHVYEFCWRHAGFGDPEAWWRLLRACASDDTSLIPDGVHLNAYRVPGAQPNTSDPPTAASWSDGEYATSALDVTASTGSTGIKMKRARSLSMDFELEGGAEAESQNDVDADVELVGVRQPSARRQRRCSLATNENIRGVIVQETNASADSADSDAESETSTDRSVRRISKPKSDSVSKSAIPDKRSARSESSGKVKSSKALLASDARAALSAAMSPLPKAAASRSHRSSPATQSPDDTGDFVLDALPSPDPRRVAQPMRHGLSSRELVALTKVPSNPVGEPRTSQSFVAVPYPQPLGDVCSQHSLFPVPNMTVKQRIQVMGYATQLVANQTPYYPNYESVRAFSTRILSRYGNDGVGRLREFFAARPWDDMWRGRVRHFYLIDPRNLSDRQLDWLNEVFEFMFEYRQAIWSRCHWLAISREWNDADWQVVYARRLALDDILRRDFKKLVARKPAGMTDMIWQEPAVWMPPNRPCSWIVAPIDQHPLEIQAAQLDEWEPIRFQWAANDVTRGRFVEALPPELVRVLESRKGMCFELPSPWNEADYTPTDLDTGSHGSPGPEYYTPDVADQVESDQPSSDLNATDDESKVSKI
ncbi:hypothetical protein PINS_up015729 [Pythium insidiosum]|nr:hypothetical protein PINS_up015729 [Pythium insidiosum]